MSDPNYAPVDKRSAELPQATVNTIDDCIGREPDDEYIVGYPAALNAEQAHGEESCEDRVGRMRGRPASGRGW